MHAARALAASMAVKPYVYEVMHTSAIGAIGNAVSQARTQVAFKVDGDLNAQDVLAKRLSDEGYKISWNTDDGPRTDDSAVMLISWRE